MTQLAVHPSAVPVPYRAGAAPCGPAGGRWAPAADDRPDGRRVMNSYLLFAAV